MREWQKIIEQKPESSMQWGLGRIIAVLAMLRSERIGEEPAIITIGGTNGKGSTCAFTANILQANGYRVGLFTSPHLWRYHERIRINGDEINDDQLDEAVSAVEAARHRAGVSLSYFEYSALAAWWHFCHHQVEVIVFEVGLGGRLDAVNAWSADVAAVVTVDLDHQAILGDTREKIGGEKIAIARTGRPFFLADTNPPTNLLPKLEELGVPTQIWGRDYWIDTSAHLEHQWNVVWREDEAIHRWSGLPQPALRGAHQQRNAALAIRLVQTLMAQKNARPHRQGITHALINTTVIGRMDYRARFAGNIDVWFDVGHNAQAAGVLSEQLPIALPRQRTLAVLGILADKDINAVVRPLSAQVSAWFVAGLATINPERGLSAEETIARLRPHFPEARFWACDDPHHALECALGKDKAFSDGHSSVEWAARDGDRILVFGSFYTVAHALSPSPGLAKPR